VRLPNVIIPKWNCFTNVILATNAYISSAQHWRIYKETMTVSTVIFRAQKQTQRQRQTQNVSTNSKKSPSPFLLGVYFCYHLFLYSGTEQKKYKERSTTNFEQASKNKSRDNSNAQMHTEKKKFCIHFVQKHLR
jgi:hypothetical protein